MPAFLERVEAERSFVLRVGPEARKFGDPYTASGTVVDLGNGAAEIKGFLNRSDDPSPVHTMMDIGRCLRQAGFTKITWERKRLDGLEPVAIKL